MYYKIGVIVAIILSSLFSLKTNATTISGKIYVPIYASFDEEVFKQGIQGIKIELKGTNDLGQEFTIQTVFTNASGDYTVTGQGYVKYRLKFSNVTKILDDNYIQLINDANNQVYVWNSNLPTYSQYFYGSNYVHNEKAGGIDYYNIWWHIHNYINRALWMAPPNTGKVIIHPYKSGITDNLIYKCSKIDFTNGHIFIGNETTDCRERSCRNSDLIIYYYNLALIWKVNGHYNNTYADVNLIVDNFAKYAACIYTYPYHWSQNNIKTLWCEDIGSSIDINTTLTTVNGAIPPNSYVWASSFWWGTDLQENWDGMIHQILDNVYDFGTGTKPSYFLDEMNEMTGYYTEAIYGFVKHKIYPTFNDKFEFYVCDLNGDNKDELGLYDKIYGRFWSSTNNNDLNLLNWNFFPARIGYYVPRNSIKDRVGFTDLNGDSKDDLYFVDNNNHLIVSLNFTNDWPSVADWGVLPISNSFDLYQAKKLNSDNYEDLLIRSTCSSCNGEFTGGYSNGSNGFTWNSISSSIYNKTVPLITGGDYDENGIFDLVGNFKNVDSKLKIGFKTPTIFSWLNAFSIPSYLSEFVGGAKFNADYEFDLLSRHNSTGKLWVLYNYEEQFVGYEQNYSVPLSQEMLVGNFNGDNRSDIIHFDRTNGTAIIKINNVSSGNVVFTTTSAAEKIALEDDGIVPKETNLYQNYPNPFNPSTRVSYYLKEDMDININIYNSLGELVYNLFSGNKSAGYHETTFDGSRLSSGVYIYILTGNNIKHVKKMSLIK